MKDFTLFAITLAAISILTLSFITVDEEVKLHYKEIELPPEQDFSDPFEKEHLCVRQALFHEARGEGISGLKAVASVILNRVQSKHYPDSFCEVIHQPWQFSYTHELKDVRIPINKLSSKDYEAFLIINELARDVVEGRFEKVFDSKVKWYHTNNVDPAWNKSMTVVAIVGNHKFFSN